MWNYQVKEQGDEQGRQDLLPEGPIGGYMSQALVALFTTPLSIKTQVPC
jgi:hypothetical protein